jgi:hypothetical protein
LRRPVLILKASYLDMENYNYNRYYSSYPVEGIPGSETWVTNNVFTLEANTDIQPVRDLKFLLGAEFKRYDWENRTLNIDETGLLQESLRAQVRTLIQRDIMVKGSTNHADISR